MRLCVAETEAYIQAGAGDGAHGPPRLRGDADGEVLGSVLAGKSGLMRLQFNKIGYEMYDKAQSRRVPAVLAKPGNPGFGFRRARWRDTMGNGEDRRSCETVLQSLGVSQERLDLIRQRVSDFRKEWDNVRRTSRPAGPGRPPVHMLPVHAAVAAGGPVHLNPAPASATTTSPTSFVAVAEVPAAASSRSDASVSLALRLVTSPMRVCVYVYVYVCVCIYVYVYVYMCMCVSGCVGVWVWVCWCV